MLAGNVPTVVLAGSEGSYRAQTRVGDVQWATVPEVERG